MKKLRSKETREKVITGFIVNLFLFSLLLFFAPLEVYVGNIGEFNFPIDHVWWVLLSVVLGLSILLTGAGIVFSQRISLLIHSVTAGIGVCCYAQMMFLNGKMVTLTGERMNITRLEKILNLGIWAGILALFFCLTVYALVKHRKEIVHVALRYIAVMLIIVQAVALITVILTTDLSKNDKRLELYGNGRFELSRENNTIVFVLDTTQNTIFERALNEYPDLKQALAGFTYYPNTTSMYSRTAPSVTYMLTGEKYYFDMPYAEYTQKAFENAEILSVMDQAGTDIRLYPWGLKLLGNSAGKYLDNSSIGRADLLSNYIPTQIVKGMLKISLYKCLPYAFKDEFEYSVEEINRRVLRVTAEPYQSSDDKFYKDLKDKRMSVNPEYQSAFRFYHLLGSHYSMTWNENMEYMEKPTYPQALRGSMRIIEECVSQLNELGILDETTIIVTADHGSSGGAAELSALKTFSTPPLPLMLVKHADSDMSKEMAISQAPVCHDDILPTVLDGCGIDASSYGMAIKDIQEEMDRERVYNYSALHSDMEGEIVLLEYAIDGNAKEFSNWTETGNFWEIEYSHNRVAKDLDYAQIMKEGMQE